VVVAKAVRVVGLVTARPAKGLITFQRRYRDASALRFSFLLRW
jgi:hypothetical protein